MRDFTEKLNSFVSAERCQALKMLAETAVQRASETEWVNMHMHSFFSFNGENYSPERLAWEAVQAGLYAAAVCDFDVLDGVPGFLDAADSLGLRAAGGFESRVFFNEYASHEVNSPGEPGVFYFMGMGFVREPEPESRPGKVLQRMLALAHERNRAVINRINQALGDVALEYERDVLPLTPAGNATERHIVRSYYDLVLRESSGSAAALRFWADKLDMPYDKLLESSGDVNKMQDILRSKLMKNGGIGYIQPTSQSFPMLDEVIEMIQDCGAMPMSAWLDGTTAGEAEPETQLDCLLSKGVVAVNIIPDRNWNIKDPDEKELKVTALNRYVAAAKARNMPINVGTELNKPGQRFVDDFASDALAPHHAYFLDGARIVIGHTRFLKYADFPYIGSAAAAEFRDVAEKNRVFAALGALPVPDAAARKSLAALTPAAAYAALRDSAQAGFWK